MCMYVHLRVYVPVCVFGALECVCVLVNVHVHVKGCACALACSCECVSGGTDDALSLTYRPRHMVPNDFSIHI